MSEVRNAVRAKAIEIYSKNPEQYQREEEAFTLYFDAFNAVLNPKGDSVIAEILDIFFSGGDHGLNLIEDLIEDHDIEVSIPTMGE